MSISFNQLELSLPPVNPAAERFYAISAELRRVHPVTGRAVGKVGMHDSVTYHPSVVPRPNHEQVELDFSSDW